MKDLTNKAVLITGAASGIGRAAAVAFAREGASPLILADINLGGLEETVAELGGLGCDTLSLVADVSDFVSVEEMARKALEKYGRIDVLVNVAGVSTLAPIEELDLEDWERVLGVNLMGLIHTVHAIYPHMLKRKSGHIVNVASADGLITHSLYLSTYFTSKFGAVGFSEALMLEASVNGIGVTCFCPGVVETPIHDATLIKGFKPEVSELTGIILFIAETPEQTASSIVKAVKKNKYLVVTTPAARLGCFMRRHFQLVWFAGLKIYARINARMFRRYRKPG